MSFNINNKLNFIDSFQFLRSLDNLIKSQESDNHVLDIAKQKGFYPDEYMSDYENFKEQLPNKEKFYS